MSSGFKQSRAHLRAMHGQWEAERLAAEAVARNDAAQRAAAAAVARAEREAFIYQRWLELEPKARILVDRIEQYAGEHLGDWEPCQESLGASMLGIPIDLLLGSTPVDPVVNDEWYGNVDPGLGLGQLVVHLLKFEHNVDLIQGGRWYIKMGRL